MQLLLMKNKCNNSVSIKPLYFVLFIMGMLFTSCAPKIYQPPHLGAEYRFDEGLKPEKPQQQLFGKSMNKYLRETGVEQESSGKAQAVSGKQPATAHPNVASDSTRRDTVTTPVPASLTASPDSSHSEPN